jgi:hypothetical protein
MDTSGPFGEQEGGCGPARKGAYVCQSFHAVEVQKGVKEGWKHGIWYKCFRYRKQALIDTSYYMPVQYYNGGRL